jgi:hypothetical protein
MVKDGLIKKILFRGATLAAISGVCGCSDNPVEPDIFPTAVESYIGPRSGEAPLPVDARLTCEDDRGIREYKIKKGNETTSNGTTPINTTLTFMESDSLSLGCTDTSDQTKWYSAYIDVTQPPINIPAQITQFQVSPTSGVSPLPVGVKYECEDSDGPDDIAKSHIIAGSDTLKTTSADTTFTFTHSGKVLVECEDKTGEGETREQEIEILEQSYSQTADTTNYVDINYSATLTNVPEASMAYLRENGDTVATRTITTPPNTETFTHAETFTGAHKGNNRFILSAPGLIPDTVTAAVAQYLPTIDLEGLVTDINETDSLIIDLEGRLRDINPEHNPVPIIRTTPLSGDVEATFSGHLLKIKGNSPGTYEVELEVGSDDGGKNTAVLRGEVFNLPRISGQIQNARTNSLELRTDLGEGVGIMVYNGADSTFLKEGQTDFLGNFDIQLDTAVSEILLQSRIDKVVPKGLVSGYVRTIRLPGRDTTNLLIRAYPYNEVLDNAGISRLDFLLHLDETNPGFRRSYVDSIEIIDVDPVDGESYTKDEQNFIKEKILDPDDIRILVEGRPLYVQIDSSATPDSEKHYSIKPCTSSCTYSPGDEIVPDSGWGIVVATPRDIPSYAKRFGPYGFRVVTRPGEFIVTHELAHIYIGYGDHATILSQPATILSFNNPSGMTKPGPADCEAAKVIYEETYKPEESPRREIYPDILGLEFLPKK